MITMQLETTKKVKKTGNSLCIFLTKEFNDMDISEGDWVKITIKKTD